MDQNDKAKFNRSFTNVDVSFSFPKSPRFRKSSKEMTTSFYSIPTAFSKRSCSFGYGKRSTLINLTVSPPPTKYSPKQTEKQGITISKSGIGQRLNLKPVVSPGPGAYSITHPQDGPMYTMWPRYTSKEIEVSPSSHDYTPNFKVVMKNQYSGTSFGIGKKGAGVRNLGLPGPGSYSLPVFFPNISSTVANKLSQKRKKVVRLKD